MEPQKAAGIIRFGAFELDRNSGELRKSGMKIHLRDQPFRILSMLIERPGEIITREEIQKILWPNDTVVEFEHSINAAIKALRQVLGDDADNPRFVETLPRRGYRFIAPVSSTGVPPVELEKHGQDARATRYRLLDKLGAGGMGEVFRARDTKLNRDVALKLLPEDFTTDPRALERFKREAQLASALNHPHICHIYDTGELDGRQFISMELVEGQTLAARLVGAGLVPALGRPTQAGPEPTQGRPPGAPLPMDSVLGYGIEIAGALTAAHRLGIIHRDLKPQNIMLTKSGTKLLDFGLAKLSRSTGVPPVALGEHGQDARATAEAESLTAQGAIMGTLHYMAPEQLEGKPADARTDIFAFGCVLYEMATGKRAFEGESSAQVMAAIMQNAPPPMVGAVRAPPYSDPGEVPPVDAKRPPQGAALQRAVKRCLAKDPDERWQSVADLCEELKWIKEGDVPDVGAVREPPLQARQRALPWAVAAVGIIAAVVFAIVAARYMLQPKAEESIIRFSVSPPENTNLGIYGGKFSLSPDGRRLAFVAGATGKLAQLYVRSLDVLAAKPLPGTENALWPFWSPDGRYLGFYAEGKLKKVEVSGGPVQTLCDATEEGATWNREGVIVFTNQGRLYRMADAGGAPTLVATPDAAHQEGEYLLPQFLPDGQHFIFVDDPGLNTNISIKVGSLDLKDDENLLEANSNALYSPPGYLLYVRAGTLMARAFDAQRLRFTADAVPIAENVMIGTYSHSYFSVSPNGVLAYETSTNSDTNQMAWFDRKGAKLGSVGQSGVYTNPALSPDGTKVAVGLRDPKLGKRDIWVYDLKRGTGSRLTFDPADDFNPAWSPDGSRIMFTSTRKGQRDIYQKPANGLGATESIIASKQPEKSLNDLSPDGRYAIYDTTAQPNNLWTLPLFGERTPFPIVQGGLDAKSAQFSPNGRFIAYGSDETGRYEVYVQTFPEHGGKWQVSTSGGIEPRWRRDGKELFYLGPDNKLMSVDVKTDSAQFEAGVPKPLFQVQLIAGAGAWRNRYVVSSDGQRFLMIVPTGEAITSPITVVVNWPALLKNSGK